MGTGRRKGTKKKAMQMSVVYLSLGSNIGESALILQKALKAISLLKGVSDLVISNFYQTAPVSPIAQRDFINAACRFHYTKEALELLKELQQIECSLGKIPKPKEAPRTIDIDILLFGHSFYDTLELRIPHPEWTRRSFVLLPLADLTDKITYPINAKGGLATLNL